MLRDLGNIPLQLLMLWIMSFFEIMFFKCLAIRNRGSVTIREDGGKKSQGFHISRCLLPLERPRQGRVSMVIKVRMALPPYRWNRFGT
jgi:hypothetical protein